MRKPWVAEKGHYLVSTDMDSAQLRLLANYMEDDEFTLAVTEGEEFKMYPPNEKPEKYCEVMDDGWYKVYVGTDAHTFNMRYFTLATDDEWMKAIGTQDIDLIHSLSNRRKKSKNGIYCLLFGGGNDKFARTLGYADSRKGKKIKDAYFTRLPKIKKLIDRLEAQFNSHAWNGGGYIQVAGGAWVWSNSKHKLLNYLLMGSEAMVQNVAIVWKNDQYERQNIQSKQVLTVHDEQTDECPVEYVEQVKDVMTQMYGKASDILKLKVAVTGTAVSGGCYLDVH
jgi:DNA polymerase I-like protein with 3'-5' exonuclease and polymerase domains